MASLDTQKNCFPFSKFEYHPQFIFAEVTAKSRQEISFFSGKVFVLFFVFLNLNLLDKVSFAFGFVWVFWRSSLIFKNVLLDAKTDF